MTPSSTTSGSTALPVAIDAGARAARGARPLSDAEAAQAGTIARQLAASLKALVDWAPPSARKVRAFAAFLGVDQNLAQRALAGAAIEPPEILALIRIPGVEGLTLLAQAARSKGCQAVVVDQLEAALSSFADLIARLGGSHAKLRARVQASVSGEAASAPAGDRGTQEQQRERLFAAALDIAGLSANLFGAISAIAPMPDSPGSMAGLTASLHIGLRGRPGGLPMALTFGDRLDARDEGGPTRLSRVLSDPQRGPGGTLLTPFTTDPLPVVTANSTTQAVTQVVQPDILCGSDPIDVAVATRRGPLPIPSLQSTPTQSIAVQIRTPARRLVMDFWVHRALLPLRPPQVGAFIYQPGMPVDPARGWYNRLPGTPVLQLLGEGLGNAECDAWPRFGELTHYLFGEAGFDGRDFVGFRCDQRFPMWCAAYLLWLDYSAGG